MKATAFRILAGVATGVLAQGLIAPAIAQTSPANQDMPVATTPPAADPTAPASSATTMPTDASEQDIIVTGIRRTIQQSLDIKRSSVNAVDSITTEDIGKLPDQNVAESLQRVPGVTIERNRGDGQFISVRGLGPDFNAVTVNGRTIATDNPGRRFSFDILPSELIVGADVYKSPTAAINGASIGATVNIRTIRPLDQKPLVIAGTARGFYNQLSGDVGPELAGVVSYHNKAGTFGVAVVASYENRDQRSDEFTIGAGHVKRSSIKPGDYFYNRTGPGVAPFANVDMPSNLSPFFVFRDRERLGLNGTMQYRPVENLTLTVDGLYSRLRQTDKYIGLAYDFSGGRIVDQVVQDGSAVYQKIEGGTVDEIIQQTPRRSDTYQIGGNLEWKSGDFRVVGDASYSQADTNVRDDNYFTTIRRTGMTMSYDRRSGSPLYDYAFSSPNYANAPTDTQHIGAHYFIVGGDKRRDDTLEYKLDGKWDNGGPVAISVGASRQLRNKTVDTTAQSFNGQCAFCGGTTYYPMPATLFTPTNYNFFGKSDANIVRDWINYDAATLIQALRDFRTPAGKSLFEDASYDPSQSSRVGERVWLGYVMLDLKGEIAGMPIAANTGVRIENTRFTSSGAARTILSAAPNGLGQNLITVSPVVPIDFSGHYTDYLPSANVRLDVTPKLVARFAASRVMTRPTLTDLSPAQSIQTNPGNETIRRGNPDLKPFRASQAEFGLEWYFQKLGLLSATAFYKSIDSFVALQTTPQRVDQVTFQVTQPTNGLGATVKGVEIGYRQVFDFLPGLFSGFGAEASYTYTSSNANYANAVTGVSYGLAGLSKNSYSAVGFYEKGPIQTRVAYTWRDRFLQVASGRNGDPEYFAPYGQLDASVSLALTSNVSLTAEALNLTDTNEFIYSTVESRTKEYRTTGRRYAFGARVRF